LLQVGGAHAAALGEDCLAKVRSPEIAGSLHPELFRVSATVKVAALRSSG
jgi:hypothetical protein